MAEDASPLSTDETQTKEWLSNTETYTDVYSQKPIEYLEAVAVGETPVWNSDLKKYTYGDIQTESTFGGTQTDSGTSDEEVDDDLPF